MKYTVLLEIVAFLLLGVILTVLVFQFPVAAKYQGKEMGRTIVPEILEK